MKYKNIVRKSEPLPGPQCRKKGYFSKEEAEDMIGYINETRVTRKITAYKCEECGLWHMTSRTRKK